MFFSASTPKLQPTNEPNSIAIEDTDDDDIIELPVPQQAQNQQIQQAPAIQTIENNASVVLSSGSEDGQYWLLFVWMSLFAVFMGKISYEISQKRNQKPTHSSFMLKKVFTKKEYIISVRFFVWY